MYLEMCMDICAWNMDSLSVSDDEPTTGTDEERKVHSRHNDQNELQRKKERKNNNEDSQCERGIKQATNKKYHGHENYI